MNASTELWYRQPAQAWTEALPVGNGRLGAMVFGGPARERLQINEETLWTGGPYSPVNPEARQHLAEVRALIFGGRYAEAEALAEKHLMGRPLTQMSYQPAGDLWIEMPQQDEVEDYRRSLDLEAGVQTTTYRHQGTLFRREVFSTAVDGVLVVRLSADRPHSVNCQIRLTSPQQGSLVVRDARTLAWSGSNRAAMGIEAALRLAMEARITAVAGDVTAGAEAIDVAGADEVVILLDVATSFRRFDDVGGDPEAAVERRLNSAMLRSYGRLLDDHVSEHRALFRRFSIGLGGASQPALPTDERVVANAETPDADLAALYVQYGRYLMLASSRPGTQPANLQGIWNDQLQPPWGSKYTANINLQMNYWLADAANLAECVEPLFRLAEDLAITGREIATEHYGARGWVLHHNTDLWRAAAPVDGAKWGLWPIGGAWLCVQLFDHLSYSGDAAGLRRLYPLMAGAAAFCLDMLQPRPGTDQLVTAPSLSPENQHPFGAAVCAGPTMDNQILRDLFGATISTAEGLDADASLRQELAAALARLPADRVGRDGQLQEWLDDWDADVPEIHHRHVSHLYGLYPSQQIDLERTSSLAAAARRSLEIRGDDATGWGIGWRINLWARLGDGEHAHGLVTRLLSPDRTYPNLFDAHPPFQIDGNFGGAAGILEMLVQSRPGEITLLPALPTAWPQGHVDGLRARGGITLDLAWDTETLRASFRATREQAVRLKAPSGLLELHLKPGTETSIVGDRQGTRQV